MAVSILFSTSRGSQMREEKKRNIIFFVYEIQLLKLMNGWGKKKKKKHKKRKKEHPRTNKLREFS